MAAVSERRHGTDCLYLRAAISIEDLRQQVKSCLLDLTPIPSAEWLRIQFWPCDPYTSRAMHHTACFNIKFRVQSRLDRADHPDSKYACSSTVQALEKLRSVKFREHCLMICLDDKANVPVGEPGKPQATGVRGHNRSSVPVSCPILPALDHDFHLAGIIPSVVLFLMYQVVHWTHSTVGMSLSHLNRRSFSHLPFGMGLSFYAFWKTNCTAKESLIRGCSSCTQMGVQTSG